MTIPSTYHHGYPPEKYGLMVAFLADRDPTTSDIYHPTAGGIFPLPSVWVNKGTSNAFILTGISAGVANWEGITVAAAGNVEGPASATDNAIVRFDSTTGKLVQNSAVTVADTTGTMTFAAGGGPVLTASGAAARKGSVTLVAGDSGAIATTSVAANSAIVLTITALGTVTAPQALYVTITPGTSFVITSADATDTSTITWAIVG